MGQMYFSNQFRTAEKCGSSGKNHYLPNGKYVVAGFNLEGTVRIWDAQSGDLTDVY